LEALQGGLVLGVQHVEVLDWIGRVGAAGAAHVERRCGLSRSAAQRRLGALVDERMLTRRAVLYREPSLYLATAAGLRFCGLTHLGVPRIGPGSFRHSNELATVAVELSRRLPGWRVISERELRAEEARRDGLLGSVWVGDGTRRLHRPDLVLISPAGRVAAVEVELSLKAPRRLESICGAWARARHVDATYYLAGALAGHGVMRAVARTRAEHAVRVLALADTATLGALEDAHSQARR
jgi:hypothetical protein